ncbi:DUF6932 family protein [Escherichia coli]|uniref:DUF6932 family protein n=1 Tax=Escherichia coli TaxID=562 RepID=UPI00345BE750
MDKINYPPLFEPGFHDMDEAGLKSYCVDCFPSSSRRGMLYCNFIQLLESIRELSAQYGCFTEIWVDGSYTTSKPEPDDIDILLVCNYSNINSIPVMLRGRVDNLLDRNYIKQNYKIDVLLLMKNLDDPNYDYEYWRSYWRGWFGFDRSENPKGLVRIFL